MTTTLKLQYEQSGGYLVLLRAPRDLRLAQAGMTVLRELGVEYELVDAARCREIEPALSADTPVHAGIHLARDGVGNCRQFAHALKGHAASLGVRFAFEHDVVRLDPGPTLQLGGHPEGPAGVPPSAAGDAVFDAVVVCAGHLAPPLLQGIGVHLPLLPVYGYSVTAPVRHLDGLPDAGPRSGLMDERYKVAITRLGQRVRVSGSAEVGGRPDRLHPGTLRTLYKVLQDWFPAAADLRQAQHWKGARPMLPDGPPVIGPSGVAGVWLNVGHGSSGWALACGSARVLADQIAGRTPAIDLDGLGIDRLR